MFLQVLLSSMGVAIDAHKIEAILDAKIMSENLIYMHLLALPNSHGVDIKEVIYSRGGSEIFFLTANVTMEGSPDNIMFVLLYFLIISCHG
jgi:hypothetical protein